MKTKRIFDLEERLIEFAVMAIKLVEGLPNNEVAKHLGRQLIRSGTAPALNYGEAQGAESQNDFLHKMKLCLKELRESQVNLKIIQRKPLLSAREVDPVLNECGQLVAIFVSSIKTAGKEKK